jgi:hypothetical protein
VDGRPKDHGVLLQRNSANLDGHRRPSARYLGRRSQGRRVAVGIDRHAKLHYGQDNVGGDHIVAVLGEQVSDDYLVELREEGVSYLFADPDGADLGRDGYSRRSLCR